MIQLVFRAAVLVLMIVQADVLRSNESDSKQPIAIVETPRLVFSDVMRGELINETFTIKNVGDSMLRFEGVEMSHTGMKIRVKQVVEPGAQIEAVIEWETHGIAGDMQGVAALLTNDPMQPRIELVLEGKIIPPIQVLPRPAFYLSQFQGEHTTTTFTIQNNQDKEIKIEKLEQLGEHFEAQVEPVTEGRQWGLIVSIPAETPVGRFQEALKIHTDDKENKTIYVQVNVLVKPEVFVNPDVIDFGRLSQSRIDSNPSMLEFLAQTLVINRREGTMIIKDIQNPLPFIEVDLIPDGPSSAFQLAIRLTDELAEIGRFDDQITLITDDPEHAEIDISVRGEVLE